MLRLMFLGTSAGVPTRNRQMSALAIRIPLLGRDWCLLDCGEGTQQQLLRAGLSLHDLRVVCISHVHGDHAYGLPGLLATMGLNGRKRPLRLIAPASVRTWLENTRQLTDLHMPFALEFVDVESLHGGAFPLLTGQRVDVSISTHPQQHRVPSHAFRFAVRHRSVNLDVEALRRLGLPRGAAWGALKAGHDVVHEGRVLRRQDFVQTLERRLVAVMGGDNGVPELLADACEGAQLLVHEATYTQAVQDRIGSGRMHSSAGEVALFAEQAGVPNLILTHFSPRHHVPAEQARLLAEARAHYRGTVFLARDFDGFELDSDGRLAAC